MAEAGANTVIAINKGSRDGLEEGHVLSISRAGRYISRDPTEKKVGEKYPITEAKFPQTTFGEEPSKKDKSKTETVKPVAKYDPEKDPANDKKLIKLPDERIGLMMIFRTFDRVSYGLIMQTSEPVNVLDIVQTP